MKKFFLYGLMLLGGASVQAVPSCIQKVLEAYVQLQVLAGQYPWFHELMDDYAIDMSSFENEILNSYSTELLYPGTIEWQTLLDWLENIPYLKNEIEGGGFGSESGVVVNAVNNFDDALLALRFDLEELS